jgi:cytochrome c oxidase subunit II
MKRFIMVIVATVALSTAVHAQEVEPRAITISAQQFEFTPSEVTLKRGETVTLRVISTDRIRGFHSKELGFNVDIRPNQPREITVSPVKAGTFVATCDSCAAEHGSMKMVIKVE